MSALPIEITPVPSVAASAADHPAEQRHLRAVPRDTKLTETATEFRSVDQAVQAGAGAIAANPTGGVAAWMWAVFVPDSGLYNDRQPSIAETLRRARLGPQLANGGALRRLSIAHGYLAAANTALVDTWKWIVNHPARLGVFVVLLGVAIAFPVTRHLLAALLAPIAWTQHMLD